MEPSRSPNDLRLLSPEFAPRTGWGVRMASWCRHNAGTWMVRLFIVIILPIGMADLGYRFARHVWPVPSPAGTVEPQVALAVPVLAGEGVIHAARLALYEYAATRPVPPAMAPEQLLFAEDWLSRQIPVAEPSPGQELTFSYDLLARAILLAQSLTPQQRASWSRYVK